MKYSARNLLRTFGLYSNVEPGPSNDGIILLSTNIVKNVKKLIRMNFGV